jgi:hypothetical protein
MDVECRLANRARSVGIDAVILLGATCGGPEQYAQVADDLGYGPLAMPDYCDLDSIRNQLLKSSANLDDGMANRASNMAWKSRDQAVRF